MGKILVHAHKSQRECRIRPQLYLDEGKLSNSVNYRKQSDKGYRIHTEVDRRNILAWECRKIMYIQLFVIAVRVLSEKNIGSCQGQVI